MSILKEIYSKFPKVIQNEFDRNGVRLEAKIYNFFTEEKDDGEEKYMIYYIESTTRLFEIVYYPKSELCLYNSMTKFSIQKIKDQGGSNYEK
ncbi:hypothetical protein BAMA_12480 [Bacillus manliponensis]|uniref:Uncharacterized protein n=1 Tax=Bacillus manliponensis TaxID=574376 RepID=A0A073JTB0_9BACI|nr:hypothetical protein [Bacillus manliponensis]KEK17550.1 hypothetical protein BAMA_12480 [Bacillus manliponensis]